jgi:hypothetical protein
VIISMMRWRPWAEGSVACGPQKHKNKGHYVSKRAVKREVSG